MKTQLLYIFIFTDCFSWFLWEVDANMELWVQEVYWRVTPVKDKKGMRLEMKGSDNNTDLTRSPSTQWRARDQAND